MREDKEDIGIHLETHVFPSLGSRTDVPQPTPETETELEQQPSPSTPESPLPLPPVDESGPATNVRFEKDLVFRRRLKRSFLNRCTSKSQPQFLRLK